MKQKMIFWNVDTEYDFMRADGKLYVKDAETIEPKLEMITSSARKLNYVIVNTADMHDEDSKELSANPDYMTTFPKHCMRGTIGAEFVEATRPINPYVIDWKAKDVDADKIRYAKEIVMYKDAFDIFEGNKHADKVVDIIKPDRAIVYGVATNVCVDYAVMGLRKRGVDVFIMADAIKELPHLPLEETLNRWKTAGAYLAKTDDIAKYILG